MKPDIADKAGGSDRREEYCEIVHPRLQKAVTARPSHGIGNGGAFLSIKRERAYQLKREPRKPFATRKTGKQGSRRSVSMAPADFGRDAGSTALGERAHPDSRNKPAISGSLRNDLSSGSSERPLRLQRWEGIVPTGRILVPARTLFVLIKRDFPPPRPLAASNLLAR